MSYNPYAIKNNCQVTHWTTGQLFISPLTACNPYSFVNIQAYPEPTTGEGKSGWILGVILESRVRTANLIQKAKYARSGNVVFQTSQSLASQITSQKG
jgi:hypothetical protein